jgi:hypothetical protein
MMLFLFLPLEKDWSLILSIHKKKFFLLYCFYEIKNHTFQIISFWFDQWTYEEMFSTLFKLYSILNDYSLRMIKAITGKNTTDGLYSLMKIIKTYLCNTCTPLLDTFRMTPLHNANYSNGFSN